MPAGNLTLVNVDNGTVVATGLKTVSQVEKAIVENLKTHSAGAKVTYAALSPYKPFGDKGIKTFEAVEQTEAASK